MLDEHVGDPKRLATEPVTRDGATMLHSAVLHANFPDAHALLQYLLQKPPSGVPNAVRALQATMMLAKALVVAVAEAVPVRAQAVDDNDLLVTVTKLAALRRCLPKWVAVLCSTLVDHPRVWRDAFYSVVIAEVLLATGNDVRLCVVGSRHVCFAFPRSLPCLRE